MVSCQIYPLEDHPGRLKKTDKRIASNLNYERIQFPVQEKDFKKIEVKNNICINVFGYEKKSWFIQFLLLYKHLKTQQIYYF